MKVKSSTRLFSLLLCSSLYGQFAHEGQIDELERKLDALSIETVWGNAGAKSAPATPNQNGIGLYIYGDYLYWRTYENNLFNFTSSRCDDIKYINNDLQQTDATFALEDNKIVSSTISLKDIKFDFDSGYRVGLGYIAGCYDNWDIKADFTRLNNTASRVDCLPCPCPSDPTCFPSIYDGYYLISRTIGAFNSEINTVLSCTDLELDYYNVDASLGRFFFVSPHLALRPHFGGRASWIDQDRTVNLQVSGKAVGSSLLDFPYIPYTLFFNIEETTDTNACVTCAKNDFWGVGPLLGLESKWFLGDRVNLYTVASAALLFGKFEIAETLQVSTVNRDFFYNELIIEYPPLVSDDFTRCITQCFNYDTFEIVPTARIGVGLAFDMPFQQEQYFASIRIGYEAQYYWRQNYYGSPTTIPPINIEDRDVFFSVFPFLFPGSPITAIDVTGDDILDDATQKIVMPNSPGDLAFHGLVVGASIGF